MPQQHGSDFHARFALASDVRKALRPLTSAAGMGEQDLVSLQQIAPSDLAVVLVTGGAGGVVVQGNQARCLEWVRNLLRELSANSPACAIVRPAAVPVLQRFFDAVNEVAAAATPAERRLKAAQWSLDNQLELAHKLPLLWPSISHTWRLVATSSQPELCNGVCSLLKKLLSVRTCRSLCQTCMCIVLCTRPDVDHIASCVNCVLPKRI